MACAIRRCLGMCSGNKDDSPFSARGEAPFARRIPAGAKRRIGGATMNRLFINACFILCAVTPLATAQPPSRAAWWLARDDVKPIADLVNTADPGKGVKFIDRVGKFQV